MSNNEDLKVLLCDEEYDPIVRFALEDMLMGMESDEQEELLWRAFLREEPLPVFTRTQSYLFDDSDKENTLPQGWLNNV